MANVDYRDLLQAMRDDQGNLVGEMGQAVLGGYLDRDQFSAPERFAPRLLTNQYGNQIYDQLKAELAECQSYTFAVAFITDAMLSNLKPIFRRLANRGVQGRLLTSTYLSFNSPKVFEELLKIPGLEVRLADVNGFHQKGYIFQKDGYQTIIIGSANLTTSALMKNQNYEWSLQISSLDNGDIVRQVQDNIEQEWAKAQLLQKSWISRYQENYQRTRPAYQELTKPDHSLNPKKDEIVPNKMQEDALGQIQALRDQGSDRGLVVSATGTGKTYLAAFDVKRARPKRMLFLAHREQILEKSCASFQKVIGGPDDDFGILSGNHQDVNAKYLFATVQTMAKEANRTRFARDAFDYILIDEVHHAGAETYQRIIDYFTPKFFLGMTATPERSDDFNIFALFNYQLAYEIRLQDALEERMLCPFHYVGVHDFEFDSASDNQLVDDYNQAVASNKDVKRYSQQVLELLSSHDRVKYVLQAADYYGYSGDQLHGLVFCANVGEAEAIATEFTRQGHLATALSGKDSVERRNQVVTQLEEGEIDYIVTVDIFNEGIDIPCVNQVIFLRNTNSRIIYVQQLGRGLRKALGKDYVEIIDFIGNYQNNYMIPIALTGDNSFSKDQARNTVNMEPTIGLSTIAFDEVAQEKIFASLRTAKLDSVKQLRGIYQNVKQQVGRVPLLKDFYRTDSIDPVIIANKEKNYGRFLQKRREEVKLSDQEDKWLSFLDCELLSGKRVAELALLHLLLDQQAVTGQQLIHFIKEHGGQADPETLASMRRILRLIFYTDEIDPKRDSYGGIPLIEWEEGKNQYRLAPAVHHSLMEEKDFAHLWQDAIETGLLRGARYRGGNPFKIGEKYTRKEALRLANFSQNQSPQTVGGYRDEGKVFVMFVTNEKADDIKESIAYNDYMIDDRHMHYYTKTKRRLSSPDVQRIMDGKHILHMFVKQNDADDGKTFYYLGTSYYVEGTARQEKQTNGNSIVSMRLAFDKAIPHDLYRLFTKN